MNGHDHHAMTAAVPDWAAVDERRHVLDRRVSRPPPSTRLGRCHRDDWAMNDRAASVRAGRLLSAYTATGELGAVDGELWIVTDDLEDPDTLTTILWSCEY